MKSRLAEWADLPTLAAISVEAFADEPAYAHFYPFREIDPSTYSSSLLASIVFDYASPSTTIFVCELENHDLGRSRPALPSVGGPSSLVGFVICKRHKADPSGVVRSDIESNPNGTDFFVRNDVSGLVGVMSS